MAAPQLKANPSRAQSWLWSQKLPFYSLPGSMTPEYMIGRSMLMLSSPSIHAGYNKTRIECQLCAGPRVNKFIALELLAARHVQSGEQQSWCASFGLDGLGFLSLSLPSELPTPWPLEASPSPTWSSRGTYFSPSFRPRHGEPHIRRDGSCFLSQAAAPLLCGSQGSPHSPDAPPDKPSRGSR